MAENGAWLAALAWAVVAGILAYQFLQRGRGAKDAQIELLPRQADNSVVASVKPLLDSPSTSQDETAGNELDLERARIIRSFESEAARARKQTADCLAALPQLTDFRRDREQLIDDLAVSRTETARYRGILIELENNAMPPILQGSQAPDDLKMIVGIGPVLERMLQQLGLHSFRQIARWTERDIDAFDARLPEFPGRIRRDEWVKQARGLHQAKYGQDANSGVGSITKK